MITAVIERLQAVAMPPLTSVSPAEELEALAKGTAPVSGAAFVLPIEETGEPNPIATGGYRQRIEVELAVVVVIRMAGDAKGGARIAAIDAYRDAVEAALMGWSPDDQAHMPLEFIGAKASPANNGVIWYVQTYLTDRTVRR